MSQLQIEIVEDVKRFESIQEEWTALLDEYELRTPFLTHEWLRCWWKHYGRGFQPLVIVVWENGKMRAAAPLMRGRLKYLGITVRVVQSMSNFHTGRIDLILSAPKTEYVAAIFQSLAAQRWDMFVMYPVLSDSPTIEALREVSAKNGYRFFTEASLTSPYVEIGGDWEHFLGTLKSKKRRFLQGKWKNILEVGTPTLESCSNGTGHISIVDTIMEISRKSWKAEEGTAIATGEAEQGFYRELADLAHQKGWLDLHVLRVADQAAAFEYNLIFGEKNYALKIGYDPAFAKHSPGSVLKKLVFNHLHARGIKEQDFLGDTDQWKRTFTEKAREHSYVRILRPNLRTHLIWLIRVHLWPWLKKMQGVASRLPILNSVLHQPVRADGAPTDDGKE